MHNQWATYLGRKRVALHTVLGAELVVQAVVDVNLLEAVPIRQRTAGQIDRRLGAVEQHGGGRVVLSGEDDTVSGVGDGAAYLRVWMWVGGGGG